MLLSRGDATVFLRYPIIALPNIRKTREQAFREEG